MTATGLLAAGQSPAAADEKTVLAAVQTLFDGMAKHDGAAIRAVVTPGGTLVVMHEGKLTQSTLEVFAGRIERLGTTKIEESIHDPVVRIDKDLAVVWAPFEVRTDGKLTSCGTDLFNLVLSDGKWLIASVAYTGRTDCAGM